MQEILLPLKKKFSTVSPLRYPGGKSALAGLFAQIINDLDADNICYVEPYAGGAGAGVALLEAGVIASLVINDIDPAVYSFWHSAINETSALVDFIKNVPLTVEEWRRQRAIYQEADEDNLLELGSAFFYLNRTNRSGILNAGVIGGFNQSGTYKIDARFNRENLVKRIQTIGALGECITVSSLDGRTVIQQYEKDPRVFMYIDPPYVEAGKRLYLNSFDGRDHIALAKQITSVKNAQWLLTYDKAPIIEHLYKHYFQCDLGLNYSAQRVGKATELLVASPSVARILEDLTQNESAA